MRHVLFFSVLFLLLLIGLLLVVNGEIDERTGIVSWIIDGDTFDISYITYRMADIDAPESYEDYDAYQTSKYYLLDLIHGKTAYLDIDDKYTYDNYGRFVCLVYVSYNSTHYLNVNKMMVNSGHAEIKNYDNEFNPYSWTLFYPKTLTPNPTPVPSPTTTPTLEPTTIPSPTVSPTSSPILTASPSITPTPFIEPTSTGPPIRFYNPYLILFGSTLLLIALGILAYFKKYRK